ncbi:NUDIX domain-containing protein [Glycomyces arizonensis]|uniref:NUDIX domain-containing protein n=1 Tax=Glycomyces arizonensis TaxID=256035 RepID=UPI0004151B61|nr:NUDIX domain-containing protein [Glycomyces arizonensis]
MSAIEATPRIDRRGARGIVADEHGHVLFIGGFARADRPAKWLLPGGGVDPGETLAEAASRELGEETGLRVAPEDLVGPVARQLYLGVREDRPWVQENHFFFTRAERFEPRICGGDAYERDFEFQWIAVDDFTATEGLHRIDSLTVLVKRLLGGDIPTAPVELEHSGPRAASEETAA